MWDLFLVLQSSTFSCRCVTCKQEPLMNFGLKTQLIASICTEEIEFPVSKSANTVAINSKGI